MVHKINVTPATGSTLLQEVLQNKHLGAPTETHTDTTKTTWKLFPTPPPALPPQLLLFVSFLKLTAGTSDPLKALNAVQWHWF